MINSWTIVSVVKKQLDSALKHQIDTECWLCLWNGLEIGLWTTIADALMGPMLPSENLRILLDSQIREDHA